MNLATAHPAELHINISGLTALPLFSKLATCAPAAEQLLVLSLQSGGALRIIQSMTRKCSLLILLACWPILVPAQDIRAKVAPPASSAASNEPIDPDTHIFRIPFGTTEDQFIAQYGQPIGYLHFDRSSSGMIYGRSACFLFTNAQLSGVRLTDNIVDWKLADSYADNSAFKQAAQHWQLSNGVSCGMSLTDVRRILNEQLQGGKFDCSFDTALARVRLEFSHRPDQGEGDNAYKLRGLLIRRK